eukprot:TRINITY_DN59572_c0_g1_i1.p1 TRINITY_DN59572_c0_g1~~TRINITY_DN59572_c0_g1_i1.p1  ORF type:complete len:247 (+),score=21.49 TRINITY_DN59572_c0_g1_i1:88-741(+)
MSSRRQRGKLGAWCVFLAALAMSTQLGPGSSQAQGAFLHASRMSFVKLGNQQNAMRLACIGKAAPATTALLLPLSARGADMGSQDNPFVTYVLPVVGILGLMYLVFFGAFLAPYSSGPSAQVSHILLETEEEARQLLRALSAADKASTLSDFQKLAREHSICESAAEGGDLGEVRRVQLLKPVADVVFDAENAVATPYGPVQSKQGYHLLWIRERGS